MNYEASIRELEERRDFFTAAIAALKKIAAHENATTTRVTTTKTNGRATRRLGKTTRAKMSASAKRRWAAIYAAGGNKFLPKEAETTTLTEDINGNVVENAPELVGSL